MVTKLKKIPDADTPPVADKTPTSAKIPAPEKSGTPLSGSVKDSAQQIWQAGLGAFIKAQVEGSKAFESLVKEGISFQRKTQTVAEEKITEATQKMSDMATDISSRASGQWDKLESIFENRVAKALNKLGVPSATDLNVLMARMDELSASVQKLSPGTAGAKPAAKSKATVAMTDAQEAKKPAKKAAKVLQAHPVARPAIKKRVSRKAPVAAAAGTQAEVNPA